MAQYDTTDGRQTVHALTTVSPFQPGCKRDIVFRECLVLFSGCSH